MLPFSLVDGAVASTTRHATWLSNAIIAFEPCVCECVGVKCLVSVLVDCSQSLLGVWFALRCQARCPCHPSPRCTLQPPSRE
jgi:hypothetical protein